MTDNDRVKIRITLESQVDGEKQISRHDGEWFRKDRTVFIRYEEVDETYGEIRTMVRWRDSELRLTRHGGVETEQSFAAGLRLAGSYSSPHGRFPLETETSFLWMQSGDMTLPGDQEDLPRPSLPMLLEWRYTMWVDDEPTGKFIIRLLAEAEEVGEEGG